jgi:glycosyl transferase family 87
MDFTAVYSGPHDLLRGGAFYPTTDDPRGYFARGEPYYVHPPSAPVALAPLGVLPEHVAGVLFIVVSAAVFLAGLYRLAAHTPFPGLILLGAGLALPVRAELGLGNADLLCAGLISLAITIRARHRAIPLALAIAIKPTAWPVLALFGLDALIALAGAASLFAVGLVAIVDVNRFFHNVIPYLANGQRNVGTVRTSLTDAAVAAGTPRAPIAAACLVVLIGAIGYLLMRDRHGDLLRHAPLVVALTLLLSSYSYVPYAVYLIAVMPLLRPRESQLWLLGGALYLIGVNDVWSSDGLPDWLNTLLNFKVLGGLLLLLPIALSGREKIGVTSPA